MKNLTYLSVASVALQWALTMPSLAQIKVEAPYSAHYSFVDLGSVPGLPPSYGGLTFKQGDPNTILIGGAANSADGKLYAVGVARNPAGHITNFTGTATEYAEAANNDGGVAYGPGGVLFLARYPNNEIGQIKPGSTATEKVIGLDAFGVTQSPGGLNFVPPGFPNEGQLKLVAYRDGTFYSVALAPDGTGTFSVTGVTNEATIEGGPEGFIYAPPGSPLFPNFDTMLVSEYSGGAIVAYRLTASGAPRPETRSVFLSGLAGAEGAAIDPVSGDFLFSTFGGGNSVIVVRGFNTPPTVAFVNPATNATWVTCLPNPLVVTANDFDGQIAKVELYLGETKLAESHSSNLSLPWMTNKVGTYSFTARATDNGGMVTVTSPRIVSVVPPPMNTLVTPGFAGSQGFHLCGNGEIGQTYTAQATTNLADGDWKNLGIMVRTNGILEFYDPEAMGLPRRFYRMWR